MSSNTKALEWIEYPERDYGVARHLHETYRPLPTQIICWHCQQSVEKSYKAILAYHNSKIPKTHDIDVLQRLTLEYEPNIKLDVSIADKISGFAAESRYPDNTFNFTNEDAEFGLKHAKQVLDKLRTYPQ